MAEAETEAEAALLKLAAALKQPGTAPMVGSLHCLGELGLDVVQRELESNIVADVANVITIANGEAGDRVKYKLAVAQMARRWEMYLAVHGIEREQEPTNEMVQNFCGFMYRYRQRASKVGRKGLGDSMAEMAQYILAQVRAPSRSNHARSSGTSEASTSEAISSEATLTGLSEAISSEATLRGLTS